MYCYTLLVATAIASFFTAQSARACTTPYQALIKEPNLSIARQAVDAAGLKETLDDPDLDATIFLPSNDGFAAFLEAANATPDDLLRFQGLGNILKYHVHLVAHNISEFQEGEVVDMINGDSMSVNFVKSGDPKYAGCSGYHLHLGSYSMTDSDPLTCDIQACKSVIHLVDYPLLPEDGSITTSFPSIAIRSDTGNEEKDEHDHEGDDHDHDEDISGVSSGSISAPWILCVVLAFLSAHLDVEGVLICPFKKIMI